MRELVRARGAARSMPPRIGAARALELMRMDKKVLAGKVRLVLLERLGARRRERRLRAERARGDLTEYFA